MSAQRYYIYGLIDPRTRKVHYVGQTSSDVRQRLSNHCSANERSPKAKWIHALLDAGLRPEIEVLQTIEMGSDTTIAVVTEAECTWMLRLKAEGHPILNAQLNPAPSRPASGNDKMARFKVPPDMYQSLAAIAHERNTTVSHIVREIIHDLVSRSADPESA